jgi:hypothetical protein
MTHVHDDEEGPTMSDRAQTTIRAWPVPDETDLPAGLLELLADCDPTFHDAPADAGRVLAIDDPEAADGIVSYAELIAELHTIGLTVYAENLDNVGIKARWEFWPADGIPVRGRMDPHTRAVLVGHDELLAAPRLAECVGEAGPVGLEQISDSLLGGVMRELLLGPPLPPGVLEQA